MADGGVAIEHLQQEQLDCLGRVKHALAPHVARGRETLVDPLGSAQTSQRIGFDSSQRGGDDGHPWPPLSKGDFKTSPFSQEAALFHNIAVTRAGARTYVLSEWHSGRTCLKN